MNACFSSNLPCPECGYILNTHDSLDTQEFPQVGDLSICAKCESLLEFVNSEQGITLAKVPPEKLLEFSQEDPTLLVRIDNVMQVVRGTGWIK